MNERILKLSIEAGDFATETYSKYTMATFFTNKSIETLFQEKFAELIVLECAEIANAGLDPDEDYLIGNDILKHFGVEQ